MNTIKDFDISDENKAKAELDELKFIFEQAEKQLKQSTDSSITIVTRTTILLTVIVGILSSIIAYSINSLNEGNFKSVEFYTALIVTLFLIYKSNIIRKNLKGHSYQFPGSNPADLLHEYYFQKYAEKQLRLKAMYLSEIESYHRRLKNNLAINEKRWQAFSRDLKLLIFLPVGILLLYGLLSILLILSVGLRTIAI